MISSTMQDFPITIGAILRHGARVYGASECVTWTGAGARRTTYAQVARNAGRLAGALARLGVGAGDPVGTFCWNNAEVETLARQSLADVRAAVTGYRDVTLAGELATGRELLRAVGITADLPGAVDIVDPVHQELFGWAVREGLTNVIRHARASSCAVRLSRSSVEIVDDGVGGNAAPGNGLSGLRERVAAAGGVLDAGPLQPRGWRLRVSLPPDGGTQ